MVALRAGMKPALSSCAVLALTTLAGCSSAGTTSSYTAPNPAIAPRTVAQAATVIEDDGLPAQAPPPARIRAMPDQPDEPFSPTYGGSNPAALGAGITRAAPPAVPAPKPGVPQYRRQAYRQTMVTAYSQDE
jgi:hypothetical protein